MLRKIPKRISPKLCLTPEIKSEYFRTGECVGIGQTTVQTFEPKGTPYISPSLRHTHIQQNRPIAAQRLFNTFGVWGSVNSVFRFFLWYSLSISQNICSQQQHYMQCQCSGIFLRLWNLDVAGCFDGK